MYYHRLGKVPPKRHTQFRQPDTSLYTEELISSKGFSGNCALLYHIHPPTCVASIQEPTPWEMSLAPQQKLLQTHLNTSIIKTTGKDFIGARKPLMSNADCTISICHPKEHCSNYFYKNAEGDELIYIHDGEGTLITPYGTIAFKQGDYLIIPRCTIYKIDFKQTIAPHLLIVETSSTIETVKRYRNATGQLMEHAPYCERDIRPPKTLFTEKKQGEYTVKIKKGEWLHHYVYKHSPLDVVGWDGYLWPYALSIHDFEPITGRIHQPPPVHQSFQANNLVICSFVPRLFDYHPQAIPAPYHHSNVNSDEVLYYAEGNFMSRKGVSRGSFTLHPNGLPHGPHPGMTEKSIGVKATHELAVMIDTFNTLHLTTDALPFVDPHYPMSWNK